MIFKYPDCVGKCFVKCAWRMIFFCLISVSLKHKKGNLYIISLLFNIFFLQAGPNFSFYVGVGQYFFERAVVRAILYKLLTFTHVQTKKCLWVTLGLKISSVHNSYSMLFLLYELNISN